VLAFAGALVLAFQGTRTERFRELRLPTGRGPGPLAVADFNGDGNPDILSGNMEDNTASLLLGDGKGKFVAAKGSAFAAGNSPNGIALGDFNADRRVDIAFANHETPFITVLLSKGKGVFEAAPYSPVKVQSKPHVHSVAALDWNNDGVLDLIADSWGDGQIEIVYGNAHGGFKAQTERLTAGRIEHFPRLVPDDLNGDGKPDLIMLNPPDSAVRVLLGGAQAGTAAQQQFFKVAAWPFAFAIGDVDGDSTRDLVVTHHTGNSRDLGADGVSVLYGRAGREVSFSASGLLKAGPAPVNVALGDVNGDGILDAAIVNQGGDSVTMLHGNKSGLGDPVIFKTGRQPFGIVLADFNRDGRADVAVSNVKEHHVLIRLSN
jgi:hypothetical protein